MEGVSLSLAAPQMSLGRLEYSSQSASHEQGLLGLGKHVCFHRMGHGFFIHRNNTRRRRRQQQHKYLRLSHS